MTLDLRHRAREVALDLTPPPDALRDAALQTWRGRMVNEHASASVFEGLAAQLQGAGVDPSVVETFAAFAEEERIHGVLCGAVVEALGGSAVAQARPAAAVPLHEDVSPLQGALRNLLSICCLSETVAVALIGAEREDMPEGPLRELLTRIWSDEVGHARAGWRILSELLPDDPACRADLAAYLRIAFAHLEAHELSHLPVDTRFGPEGAPWGLCDGAIARELFFETVQGVIVVGLERHGIAAEEAWQNRGGAASG